MNLTATTSTPPKLVPLMAAEDVDFFSDAQSELRPSSETITRWLSELGKLHRSSAGSPEFYADAARFAVQVVGLDGAAVFVPRDGQWHVVSKFSTTPSVDFNLNNLSYLSQQATTWYQPRSEDGTSKSKAEVVAPILDDRGQLIAAILGVRSRAGENRRLGIRPLEARLMQLLAESVSVGMARMDRESEAARATFLLEQAFSPTIARYIQAHPDSLSGQLREVTLLFADLCGFTSHAEQLSPADCYGLLANVMELLTEIVIAHHGVVVDYYGDGMLALWNAPIEQADHASLACAAAHGMLERLPIASRKWRTSLHQPLQLAVGIHTGPALVGNAGTRNRIKYGPRGNAVNTADRVQAASKQLQLPLVMTKASYDRLSSQFAGLRICTAKLPGLEQELDLYTAFPIRLKEKLEGKLDRYSHALKLFEAGDLVEAERLLEELAKEGGFPAASFLSHYTAEQLRAAQGRRVGDKAVRSSGRVIEFAGK